MVYLGLAIKTGDFPTGAKRREWIGMGVAGMIITSDEMDHSRKFPAFSTSKKIPPASSKSIPQKPQDFFCKQKHHPISFPSPSTPPFSWAPNFFTGPVQ